MAVKLLACDTDCGLKAVSYEKDIWTWGKVKHVNKLLDFEELYNFLFCAAQVFLQCL
jgi:hypothetical protein